LCVEKKKKSFETLKERLINAKTLGIYDKDARTRAIADASPVAVGCVLTQMDREGKWRKIEWLSVGHGTIRHIAIGHDIFPTVHLHIVQLHTVHVDTERYTPFSWTPFNWTPFNCTLFIWTRKNALC